MSVRAATPIGERVRKCRRGEAGDIVDDQTEDAAKANADRAVGSPPLTPVPTIASSAGDSVAHQQPTTPLTPSSVTPSSGMNRPELMQPPSPLTPAPSSPTSTTDSPAILTPLTPLTPSIDEGRKTAQLPVVGPVSTPSSLAASVAIALKKQITPGFGPTNLQGSLLSAVPATTSSAPSATTAPTPVQVPPAPLLLPGPDKSYTDPTPLLPAMVLRHETVTSTPPPPGPAAPTSVVSPATSSSAGTPSIEVNTEHGTTQPPASHSEVQRPSPLTLPTVPFTSPQHTPTANPPAAAAVAVHAVAGTGQAVASASPHSLPVYPIAPLAPPVTAPPQALPGFEDVPAPVLLLAIQISTTALPNEHVYGVTVIPPRLDWGRGRLERKLCDGRTTTYIRYTGRVRTTWFFDRAGTPQSRVNVGVHVLLDTDEQAMEVLYQKAAPPTAAPEVVFASRLQGQRERGSFTEKVVPFRNVFDARDGVLAKTEDRRMNAVDFTDNDVIAIDAEFTRWKPGRAAGWTQFDVGFELAAIYLLWACP